ncbi:MAG TPA: leishmanolysin-related zinc metalloendopeptidase [Longimicrobiaceae bacterium]|jgi:hypothetical protein|nr:leishmanolysin-related zinc metalloendopeptidase [Longimicrobiaceae bacterium]
MRKLLIPAAALLAAGCADSTRPPVPASVIVAPGSISMDAVGATKVVHASVVDDGGKGMPAAALTWSSSSPAVTVAPMGGDSAKVAAAANGTAAVTASSGGASGTVAVHVAQVLVGIADLAGPLNGVVGHVVDTPVRVKALDRLNVGIPGQSITFQSVVGGGTFSPATAVTDENGIAATTWTLGPVATTQQALVSLGGLQLGRLTAVAAPTAPAAALKPAGDDNAAVAGTAVAIQPRVIVLDSLGNPLAGLPVSVSVTSGGGSVTASTQPVTGTDGQYTVSRWVLGPTPGPNTLTATFPGTGVKPLVFSAQGLSRMPAAVAAVTVTDQAAMAGTAVPSAPAVVVRDAAGNPMPGIAVRFAVTGGGGSVGDASVVSNASGVAVVSRWELGAAADLNTLTATVPGLPNGSVVFRGAGCSGSGPRFEITVCITTPMTAAQRGAFQFAAAKWSTVITGDLPDVAGSVAAGDCGDDTPAASQTFDDLLIFASVKNIDGPGRILGQAGPCYTRNGAFGLPVVGVMEFDAADLANMETTGTLRPVILHEMGHVLGVGSLWYDFGLLQDPSGVSTFDTYYNGSGGLAGFADIGGNAYTAGKKVPVENSGGAGTMNGHWRESVLGIELMTGYVAPGPNPLSLLTVRSLADLGYTVDPAAADGFALTLASSTPTGASLRMVKMDDDVYPGPRYKFGPRGTGMRVR